MTRRDSLVFPAACAGGHGRCGGGGDSPTAPALAPTGTAPYSQTDLRRGHRREVHAGQAITVTYTGWLYSDTAAENKGTVFDAAEPRASSR